MSKLDKNIYWKTSSGNKISIDNLDDNHLNNCIKVLLIDAKKKALRYSMRNLTKKEKNLLIRKKKLQRISLEDDYDIIWEQHVDKIYWNLIYEQRKRENVLF